MTQAVIDTLQLADRLKESGFQDRQAEGLARALGDVFTDQIVTKADLDSAIQVIRADYRALDDKFEARFGALDGKFEARFNSLSLQIRFIFATLAMLLALGLIDTVPRLIG